MTRLKRLRRLAAALPCLLVIGNVSGCTSSGVAPPDAVILVSLDTLRADYLNTYGYTRFATTPVLDAFALENILFEHAFITEPWTLTSHMSLMTGLHRRHGVQTHAALPAHIPTLAALVRDRGYRTQAFVDGGYLHERWGFDRGFDGFVMQQNRGFETIMPAAMKWIDEHRDERFFLFLHTYDVHATGLLPRYVSPYPFYGSFSGATEQAEPGPCEEAFQRMRRDNKRDGFDDVERDCIRAAYAEGVRYVDDQLGRLFAHLRERGLYDRALIVVWSDHGEGLFDHEDGSHGEVFEHTIRVPLLMKIPGHEAHGRRIRSFVSSVDIMPTILELVGAKVPPDLDGTSMLPLLRADPGGGTAFSQRVKEGVRLFSIRRGRYHYIRDAARDRTYFFDLESDPEERHDLHPSSLPEEAEMAKSLDAWIRARPSDEESDAPAPRLTLDPATAEKLKALGYVEEHD